MAVTTTESATEPTAARPSTVPSSRSGAAAVTAGIVLLVAVLAVVEDRKSVV